MSQDTNISPAGPIIIEASTPESRVAPEFMLNNVTNITAPSCSTSNELHHLKTTPLVKGFTDHKENIPSHFKRVLFWKEDGPIEVKKKRKEELPAIATSPQMLEYFNKKLNTKKEMERQKEERKLAREEKKGI